MTHTEQRKYQRLRKLAEQGRLSRNGYRQLYELEQLIPSEDDGEPQQQEVHETIIY